MNDAINAWLEGFDYLPRRIEGIYEIVNYYREKSKYKIANYFYELACKAHKRNFSTRRIIFKKRNL